MFSHGVLCFPLGLDVGLSPKPRRGDHVALLRSVRFRMAFSCFRLGWMLPWKQSTLYTIYWLALEIQYGLYGQILASWELLGWIFRPSNETLQSIQLFRFNMLCGKGYSLLAASGQDSGLSTKPYIQFLLSLAMLSVAGFQVSRALQGWVLASQPNPYSQFSCSKSFWPSALTSWAFGVFPGGPW